MARLILSLALIAMMAVVLTNAQPQCVTFCNSLQILMGQCSRECPSTTTRRTTTTTRRSRNTTPSPCDAGYTFCSPPANMTSGPACANGSAPFELTWTNLGTLFETGNASEAGLDATTAKALASYFSSMGSYLNRLYRRKHG